MEGSREDSISRHAFRRRARMCDGEGTMKTVVVIPPYNERDHIQPLLDRLLALPSEVDIFFVDDGSPDGTGELLESLRGGRPRLRVLHRPGKLGLGTAYRHA